MLYFLESALFFGIGPLLWASGLVLFLRSSLSPTRKAIWTCVLVAVGVTVGIILSAPAIRQKFAIVILLLPVLALIDAKLMSSRRGFTFWLRACGFEVCTVFAVAAWSRYVVETIRFARWFT